jgi:hypothetical protein
MTYDEAISVLRDPDAHDDNASFIAAEIVLEGSKVSASDQHAASVIAEAMRKHRPPRARPIAPRGVGAA